MTAACRLCGQLIDVKPPGVPIVGDPEAAAVEYQATVQAFANHVSIHHQEYIQVLAGTAHTYHLHLIAKLAESTSAAFKQEQEAARALCYWTLAGEFGIESKTTPPPPLPPLSRPV